MTDEELRTEILNIAAVQNIGLTEEEILQIINLCRTLENLDTSEWADKLSQLGSAMKTVQEAGEGFTSFFSSVGDFFVDAGDFFTNTANSIGNFFTNLFSGN